MHLGICYRCQINRLVIFGPNVHCRSSPTSFAADGRRRISFTRRLFGWNSATIGVRIFWQVSLKVVELSLISCKILQVYMLLMILIVLSTHTHACFCIFGIALVWPGFSEKELSLPTCQRRCDIRPSNFCHKTILAKWQMKVKLRKRWRRMEFKVKIVKAVEGSILGNV